MTWNLHVRPRRPIRGITTQSAPKGEPKHSALMSVINVTFVNFTGSQYAAFEACGKCKAQQGGGSTFTAGLRFVQQG